MNLKKNPILSKYFQIQQLMVLNLEFEETNANEKVLIELYTIDGKIIKKQKN